MQIMKQLRLQFIFIKGQNFLRHIQKISQNQAEKLATTADTRRNVKNAYNPKC